jgi:predicted ATPase/DNA-binding CsgD family transcriptional regulator
VPTSKNKIFFGNLPASFSSFVGREREIREIQKLLLSNRLVTLTGPGGCGKTRLSIKIAQELSGEFERGVWLVELASISDPTLVPQTIAAALNVREKSGRELMDLLIDSLSARTVLLVIDNCEHLILACAYVAEMLLQNCPDLKILATSREALGLTGEIAWIVPPLSLPEQQPWTNPVSAQDAVHFYAESESVQLFVNRAKAISPDFTLNSGNGPWVAEICRRLDGMPLAIELAAARVRSLTVQEIAQRLDDRFNLLTGGSRTGHPRQQTLAATLEWSYALLLEKEKKVLQRLSVFAGGATMEAAESVCSGDGVEAAEALDVLSYLVDKSLVTAYSPERGETRYRLLETIRQYALDKLAESGEVDESNNRHLDFFIGWAERAEPYLNGSEQVPWLNRFEIEHDNLRVALEWSLIAANRAEIGLRLAVIMAEFWKMHGYHGEGRARLTAALAHRDVQQPTLTRAQAFHRASTFAFYQSDYSAARVLAEENLVISRKLGSAGRLEVANALEMLAEVATEIGDYSTATKFYEEALPLYREVGDLVGIGDTLKMLGWGAMRIGDYEQAESRLNEGLIACRQSGDLRQISSALSGLGELAVRRGQYERASDLLRESLNISEHLGEKWGIAIALGSLGWLALRQHDFREMMKLLGESLGVRMETGDRGGIAWCLEKLAEADGEQSHFQRAAVVFGAASALRAPLESVMDGADLPDYERMIFRLRTALGKEAFAEAWNEGQAMTLKQAVDYALAEPEPVQIEVSLKEKFGGLTGREREVAALIAQGKSNREIALVMTVGAKTVETYVTRILNKLGFDSRVQIATWAIEKGLISSMDGNASRL